MLRRLWTEETGAQSLEFVALLPLVILALHTMLQMAFLGYAFVVIETSAREAALTAARDPGAASARATASARTVAGGLSVSVTSVHCSGGDMTVELKGEAPNLLFSSPISITRKVTMPTQDGRCS